MDEHDCSHGLLINRVGEEVVIRDATADIESLVLDPGILGLQGVHSALVDLGMRRHCDGRRVAL